MILNGSNPQFQAFEYDIAKDPAAGALGTVNLGYHMSRHCTVFGFWIKTLIAPTSAGGLATLAFGWNSTGIAPPLTSPFAYMLPNLVGAFVPNFPTVGNILYVAPEELNVTTDVIMTIGIEPLLTGRLVGMILYEETEV